MGKPLGVYPPPEDPDNQQKLLLDPRLVISLLLSLLLFFSFSIFDLIYRYIRVMLKFVNPLCVILSPNQT